MIELLEIPDVRERVAPLSIERYHRMIELGAFEGWDVELLGGVPVEKMSKSELHILVVDWLLERLERHCSPSDFWVRQELPITMGNSEPEPDISVVKGQRSELRRSKPTTALFVVEVAIHSLALDRVKAGEYARAGVDEYWIVQPRSGITEVHRRPENGMYAEGFEVSAEAMVESKALPGFSVKLSEALA